MLLPRCLAVVALLAVVSGCSANVQPDAVAAATYASAAPARASDGPYLLGPGDKVHIRAYDDTNLTGDYEVSSSGYISVPLIGQVKATGSTTHQLEETIAARMRGRIAHDPKINVEMTTYAPFYIYGEVKKAGVYPYQPGLTVADAIATAGGLTYRANEQAIYLQHAGSRTPQTITLDVPVRIHPGDNIRVTERIF